MSEGAERVDVVVVGVSEASHARTVQLASELAQLSGKSMGDVQFALLGGQFVVHRGLSRDGAGDVVKRLRELGAEVEVRLSAVDAIPAPEKTHRRPRVDIPQLEPDTDFDLAGAPTLPAVDPPSGAIDLGPPPEFGELTPTSRPDAKPISRRSNKRPTGELDPSRPHGRLEEGQAEWPFTAGEAPESKGSSAEPMPPKPKRDSSEGLPRRVRPSSRGVAPTRTKSGSIKPEEIKERIPTGPFDTVDGSLSESVELLTAEAAQAEASKAAESKPKSRSAAPDPLDLGRPPPSAKHGQPKDAKIEVDYAAAGVVGRDLPTFGASASKPSQASIRPAASSSAEQPIPARSGGPRPRTIPPGQVARRLLGSDPLAALLFGILVGLVVSTLTAYEVARRVTGDDVYALEEELEASFENPVDVEDGVRRSPADIEGELESAYGKTRLWFWGTWLVGIPLGIVLGRIRLS